MAGRRLAVMTGSLAIESRASTRTVGDGAAKFDERLRCFATRRDRIHGFVAQSGDPLLRRFHAVDARERQFAGVGVLVRVLSEMFGGLHHVQQVVRDLEEKAQAVAVSRQCGQGRIVGAGGASAHATRRANQRASLRRVDDLEPLAVVRRPAPDGVEQLAADHTTRRRREFADQRDKHVGGEICLGDDLERVVQQRVAGQNGRGFVGVDVERGPAATEVVVIHRRQVVMHQAERVDAFDRDGGRDARASVAAGELRGEERERRSNPLTAAQRSVRHGRSEGLRSIGALNRLVEAAFEVADEVGQEGRVGVDGRRSHGPILRVGPGGGPTVAYDGPMAGPVEGLSDLIVRGGVLMAPLIGLCVVSVTLTLERAWFWLTVHRPGRQAGWEALARALRKGEGPRIRKLLDGDSTVYAAFVRQIWAQGATDAVVLEAVEGQRPRIDRFMNALSTIITAAPLIGILGTVIGIIQSFNLLGEGATLTDPRPISAGIAQALLTTALGLVVALITLFPYMAFRAQSERALGRMESLAASAQQGKAASSSEGDRRAPSEASDRREPAKATSVAKESV